MQKKILAVLLASMFVGDAWAEDKIVNISAQDMPSALHSLASQTGIQLLFTADEIKNLKTNSVVGSMSAEAALNRLLEGTNYTYRATGNGTYVLQRMGAVVMLDEVIVSATRTANNLSKVPASVSLVTQDDFSGQQAATVGDVMKKLPNVDFGGGPRADGQIPTIRGYQGNGITLLVDGARRNANYGLTTPLFIDPFFLARAEVVRGASSSLYGSGGNGGAMVFTTLAAKDLLRDGASFGGDVRAGYSSGDLSHRYNARVYGAHGAVDALLAVGYQDFNDIRQGSGALLQLNSGHGDSALLKAGLQATDTLRFELSHQTFFKQTLEPNNPQLVTATQTQLTRNHQDETILKASMLDGQGGKALDARVYRTKTTNQRDRNGVLPYWNSVIETTGASAQNTTRVDTSGMGEHRLTYGFDTYEDKLNTIQGVAANPVNPDGKASVSGIFLQDEIAAGGAWRITPSIRYDSFSTVPANVTLASTNNSHVSPKVALAWQSSPGFSLYGSYGQAYRAPSIWEMYASTQTAGIFPTTNFNNFSSNPNLRPETVTTLEIGTHVERQQLFAADDNLRVRATAFQAKAKDMITSATIGSFIRTGFLSPGTRGFIFQSQNVSKATRNGVEIEGNYRLGAWLVNANYSRLRVTDDVTGSNLFAPPDKLATQLRYTFPSTDMFLTWGVTAVAAQDYDATVARRRSGYTVHDLYATWQLPNQSFRVDFGIGNLLDKRYLSYQQSQAAALGAYEMGRNYKLSFTGSF